MMKDSSRINLKSKKGMLAAGLILLLFGILVAAYTWPENAKFKSYSVGFSTPGDYVWVTAAMLDQRIEILGGSIQGRWEEGGANNAVFDAPMPHEIYVSWIEQKTKVHYKATVKLVDDLAKRARKLGGVTITRLGIKDSGDPYIIIGLASDGKVVVWLSNYPYGNGIAGRVLEVIGEAQGVVSELKPHDPYLNKKQQIQGM